MVSVKTDCVNGIEMFLCLRGDVILLIVETFFSSCDFQARCEV